MNTQKPPQKYIFFLVGTDINAAHGARDYLRKQGIKVLRRHGVGAFVAVATPEQVAQAYHSDLFRKITKMPIPEEYLKYLTPDQVEAARLWNFSLSPEYLQVKADTSQKGKSWGDPEKEIEPPHLDYDPEQFKNLLLAYLKMNEAEFLEKNRIENPEPFTGDAFVDYEKRLRKTFGDSTIAYHLARIAFYLPPEYREVILELPKEFIENFLKHVDSSGLVAKSPDYDRAVMKSEVAVGVIFVMSSQAGGPTFSTTEQDTLCAEIMDGLDWLAWEAPVSADLSWSYDWHFLCIDVADGTSTSTEDYWRNPAMEAVHFEDHTYTGDWDGVAEYLEDLRIDHLATYSLVIFVTPFATDWFAYGSSAVNRVTLAKNGNWGGWTISGVDRITAHEVCHVFCAADEYAAGRTPCTECGTLHGRYQMPNGNCAVCSHPHLPCIMDDNDYNICAYTRAQIGWSSFLVELTTGDAENAGTDDKVWLDIGEIIYELDTPGHNDRERGHKEGYAIDDFVMEHNVKRVGIRKAPDVGAGGWYLEEVRVWLDGDLLLIRSGINQWLQNEYCWWSETMFKPMEDIVNLLRVVITTGDHERAGTGDPITFRFGGHSWLLDNYGRNDFEPGQTDTFHLDPGTNLRCSILNEFSLHKGPDSYRGGWKLKGLQIFVNKVKVYDNPRINQWLQNDDRDFTDCITV